MNIKFAIKHFVIMMLLGFPFLAISQLGVTDVISTETYSFDVQSNPNQPDHLTANNGSLTKTNNGSGNFTLHYTSNAGFVGYDTISYKYWDGPGQYTGTGFMVNVVLSIITTNPDYASTEENNDVLINVLDNDSSTDNTLFLSGIPIFNNGIATIVPPNSIYFSPDANFSGSTSLNYTVCDSLGTCATETVIIFVNSDGGTPEYDTLNLQVKKNTLLNIPLPVDGYSIDTSPNNGSAVFSSSTVVEYDPNVNFTGMDEFTITKNIDGVDTYITINVDVLEATAPNSIAFDDYIFTAKNTAKEFNVVANDLFSNARIKYYTQPKHGTVTKIGNQSFRYTPNAGFSGSDKFKYTLKQLVGGGVWESAWVYVNVSNQEPSQDTYTFETAKNTTKVLYYDSPISEFNFTLNSSPDHGLVEVLSGMVDTTILGQSIVGDNLIIYTPNTDYVGNDEFEINYCVNATGNCANTKIIMHIMDNANMTTCISDDCVWPGDCNNDGVVNMVDLLHLGLGIGELGANRPSASTTWTGQESYDWNKSSLGKTVDLKYIDTNGDGFVTMDDKSSIGDKYGLTHSLTPEYNPYKKTFPINLVNADPNPPAVYHEGDLVTYKLTLGDNGNDPIIDMYGFTFTFDYPADLIDETTFVVDYDPNNWMTLNSPVLSLDIIPTSGRMDIGYTRTNGYAVSGYGDIATVSFIVDDDVIGIRQNGKAKFIDITRPFEIKHFGTMDGAGVFVEGQDLNAEITVRVDLTEQSNTSNEKIIITPNPASDFVNIHLNGGNNIESVQVYNVSGQLIKNINVKTSRTKQNGGVNQKRLDISGFENGMYVIKVLTDRGSFSEKLVVTK